MRTASALLTLSGLLVAAGCSEDGTTTEPAPTLDAELRRVIGGWGVLPIGSLPAPQPALVELGRALFFDKILSGNRDVACATCHQPAAALADGRSLPIGTGGVGEGESRTLGPGRDFVPRSAPSLLNVGLGAAYLLWDGRISGFGPGHVFIEDDTVLPTGLTDPLTAQAFLPVLNRREMRGEPGDLDVHGDVNELAALADDDVGAVWSGVVDRLLDIPEYVELFGAAFPETHPSLIRYEHVGEAIATFERSSFMRTNSPFDRYLDRDDAALTVEQKRGALLFFGEGRCASCHSGPMLGGQSFANVGAPQIGPGTGDERPLDVGRGALQHNEFYRFAFRVPTLRNVELTAPYMHAGAYASLEAVVDHYDDVPEAMHAYDPNQLEEALRGVVHADGGTLAAVAETLDGRLFSPLELAEEDKAALVSFLEALTDPAARDLSSLVPARVPSGLPVR